MASMSTVMKNLYTFANILVQAGTGAVSQWDLRSISNAYNWASYCQKFYQVTRDKSFAVHLDRQIRSLALLLDPPGLLELNLERLQYAASLLTKSKSITVLKLVNRFLDLSHEEKEALEDEAFLKCILSPSQELPPRDEHNLEEYWRAVSNLKNPATGKLKFELLCRLSVVVLSLPHFNADTERTFSILRKIQSDSSGNLDQRTIEGLLNKILGNPATTDKLTFYIIDKYTKAEDPQQIEELNKICRELSIEKDQKEEEQNKTNEIQEKRNEIVLVDTQAKILMECLHHHFLHTSDMVRFDKYLKDMLQRICKGRHGWNIILKFLMLGIPMEMSEAQMLHIEKSVLQFLCDSSNDRRLWESDAHVLAQLSSRYPQIGMSYLNHLVNWSRSMETVYNKTDSGTLYEWRDTGHSSVLTAEDQRKDSSGTGNHSKSFEALQKRLYILAQSSVKTEDLVLEALTDLSQSSYFNIWRDLLKKLFIT